MTDEEIVKEIANGNLANFNILYDRHREKFWRLAKRILKDDLEAEDITQNSYIKLIEKAHQFKGESKFTSWFYRVVSNLSLMRLRELKKKQIGIDNLIILSEDHYHMMDSRVEAGILLDIITKRMKGIPEMYQQVLHLRLIAGLKPKEIAEVTGLTLASVKTRYYRGIRVLSKSMKKDKIPLLKIANS